MGVDYEQYLFPGFQSDAQAKRNERARLSLPVYVRRLIYFSHRCFFGSRDGLSWERGTARSLLLACARLSVRGDDRKSRGTQRIVSVEYPVRKTCNRLKFSVREMSSRAFLIKIN